MARSATQTHKAGEKRIAVVGGGPKAVALAVKATTLEKLGGPKIKVVAFDQKDIGAAWSGAIGYTDGKQRLCTLAERDLGYPYADSLLNSVVASQVPAAARAAFSWASYVETSSMGFADWINDGRLPPVHDEFVNYLQWAFENSGQQQVREHVVHIEPSSTGQSWNIITNSGAHSPFDGVVLTGTGPAKQVAGPSSKRVFNGQDFWLRLSEVERYVKRIRNSQTEADSERIIVVGAGGTAASILGWLIEHGAKDLQISVIASSQAALHLRAENPFENRYFSDTDAWKRLDPKTRRTFTDRLNRGVVWESVLERLAKASFLEIVEGRAKSYKKTKGGALSVACEVFTGMIPAPSGGPLVTQKGIEDIPASMLIDASGFDSMHWTSFFNFLGNSLPTDFREVLETRMNDHLRFTGDPWDDKPPVHAPMLSTMIGPGYASLMSLGSMADRILSAYGA